MATTEEELNIAQQKKMIIEALYIMKYQRNGVDDEFEAANINLKEKLAAEIEALSVNECWDKFIAAQIESELFETSFGYSAMSMTRAVDANNISIALKGQAIPWLENFTRYYQENKEALESSKILETLNFDLSNWADNDSTYCDDHALDTLKEMFSIGIRSPFRKFSLGSFKIVGDLEKFKDFIRQANLNGVEVIDIPDYAERGEIGFFAENIDEIKRFLEEEKIVLALKIKVNGDGYDELDTRRALEKDLQECLTIAGRNLRNKNNKALDGVVDFTGQEGGPGAPRLGK
ncbi:MAG: hypothetical protein HON32_04100, partial [Francisellaceae bacterium]|nr:hypothetical protein [Francisellaceae bacterium]